MDSRDAPGIGLPRRRLGGTDGAAPCVINRRRRRFADFAGLRIHDLAGEIQARVAPLRVFRLRLRSEKDEPFAEVAYDPSQKDAELRVNGTAAAFTTNGAITLRMFLDGSVLEVFASDRVVITARLYSPPTAALKLEAFDVEAFESLEVWGMRPISKDRLTS